MRDIIKRERLLPTAGLVVDLASILKTPVTEMLAALHADAVAARDQGHDLRDLPYVPVREIFDPGFLVKIKPLMIMHTAMWTIESTTFIADLARRLGKTVYLAHDVSNWVFVTLEPWPEDRIANAYALVAFRLNEDGQPVVSIMK